MSPSYIHSPSSLEELNEFLEQARLKSEELFVNDKPRVLPILIFSIPRERWPREISRFTEYHVFFADYNGDSVPLTPKDSQYDLAIYKVAATIADMLMANRNKTHEEGIDISRYDDVFLSYSHKDIATAKALADRLSKENLQVFYDQRILPGKDWEKTLEDKLEEVSSVIVLWSKASTDSEWVPTEAHEALNRGKLIPVFIENVRPPLRFRKYHGAKLINWDHKSVTSELKKVIKQVRELLGTRGDDFKH